MFKILWLSSLRGQKVGSRLAVDEALIRATLPRLDDVALGSGSFVRVWWRGRWGLFSLRGGVGRSSGSTGASQVGPYLTHLDEATLGLYSLSSLLSLDHDCDTKSTWRNNSLRAASPSISSLLLAPHRLPLPLPLPLPLLLLLLLLMRGTVTAGGPARGAGGPAATGSESPTTAWATLGQMGRLPSTRWLWVSRWSPSSSRAAAARKDKEGEYEDEIDLDALDGSSSSSSSSSSRRSRLEGS